jgi:hypothetical protein
MSFPVSDLAETVSLVLILLSFVSLLLMASRAKSLRSFQFQMFFWVLVLALAEVPHILDSLQLINLASIEDIGLTIHTVAMILFASFIFYRTFQFFKGKELK